MIEEIYNSFEAIIKTIFNKKQIGERDQNMGIKNFCRNRADILSKAFSTESSSQLKDIAPLLISIGLNALIQELEQSGKKMPFDITDAGYEQAHIDKHKTISSTWILEDLYASGVIILHSEYEKEGQNINWLEKFDISK